MVVSTRPKKRKRVFDLSGFRCPKCDDRYKVFSFKVLGSKGYSCQTCGYTFIVAVIDLLAAGRDRKKLVEGEAKKVLARKGF